jgi:molybdenum storage protein
MPLIRERDSKRLHIKSKLMGESLVGKAFLKSIKSSLSNRKYSML